MSINTFLDFIMFFNIFLKIKYVFLKEKRAYFLFNNLLFNKLNELLFTFSFNLFIIK